ncbi:MAG: hypothetical protein ABW215_13920 [Kibdelosporangium sp.]
MLRFFRRRVAALRGVHFCDSCHQVCTPGHRSDVIRDKTRLLADPVAARVMPADWK